MLDEVFASWEAHHDLITPPAAPIQIWVCGSRTIYVAESWGPAVPYPALDHRDGAKNYGYVRLKGNPRAISQIPETQGWPELGQFLEAVNAATSPIESVGCEKAFFVIEDKDDATRQLGSYVDVIFTDAVLNERPKKLLSLAVHLMTAVEGCETWWGTVEIGLQRLRYLAGANLPWGLMLRICNYGRGEDEARKFWGESLQRLGKAISELPRDFGHAE